MEQRELKELRKAMRALVGPRIEGEAWSAANERMREKRRSREMANKLTGYLLTEDITAMFGVTRRTVYRWIENGTLHPKKAGRTYLFDPAEVAKLKTARRNDPRTQARKGK